MSTLSFHQDDSLRPYALSWAFSVLFHGLAVASAVVFVADLHMAPQPEPFKWDVSVVETSSPTEAARPSQPTPAPSQPTPQPVESQPVVQTAQTVQQVVHKEVRTVTPVVHATPQPTETVTRPPQPVETPTQTAAEPVPQTASIQPAQPVSESGSIRELPVRSRPTPRRDYGWLAESLWGKVEQLKRYPSMARMNRWEGKVVLKAVIRDDGTIIDMVVIESSGHAVLDQDALEIVKRASPLTLKHELGQPQVVVQIPINYSLR